MIVVGAPESLTESIRQHATLLESLDYTGEEPVRRLFAQMGTVTQVLEATFYGYTDEESFDSVTSAARLLTADNELAHDRFRTAIPDEEWEQDDVGFSPGETV